MNCVYDEIEDSDNDNAQNTFVVRTITQDAFGGLISPRDFVDLVINEKTDDYLATSCE